MSQQPDTARFPWDLAILAALGLYVATLVNKIDAMAPSLGDTDNAMRLVQLRDYLQNGNWYNLHTDRLAPGLGYTSHWSRLPDLLMAIIYKLVLPFSSAETAEWAVKAFYPGLWRIPLFVAISGYVFAVSRNRFAAFTVLIVLAMLALADAQFGPGRIDHHNAQIALAAIITVATGLMASHWRYALVFSISAGLLLAIGLEALPFLVVCAAIVALRYVIWNAEPATTRIWAATFAFATAVAQAISLSPSTWSATACDAIAINWSAPLIVGSSILFVWSSSKKLSASALTRGLGLGLAGGMAAALFAWLDPACLAGPFGHVNPLVKPIWLDQVAEMQPLYSFTGKEELVSTIVIANIMLLGLLSSIWLLTRTTLKTSLPVITMVLAYITATILGNLNIRMAYYVIWFAAPLICVALLEAKEQVGLRKFAFAAPVLLLFAPFTMALWLTPLINPVSTAKAGVTAEKTDCFATKNYTSLAKLPQGLIMADVDLGPFILALTPHSVMSAPYHRISDSILQNLNFFKTENTQGAKDITTLNNITYVVVCKEIASNATTGLGYDLRKGVAPSWLKELPGEVGNPLRVFAVKGS